MYCEKCNKVSKKGENYCSECGTKLKRKEFKISDKSKNVIISFIFLLTVLIVVGFGLNYIGSPEFKSKEYFESVINNDADKIYSYLEDYKSDFVSKEILKEKMSLFENVEHYSIINVEKTEKNAIVEYEYQTSNEIKTIYVLLTKENDNILNSWHINSGKIKENIKIKVPTGSVITIDDKEITKYQNNDEDEYYDTYEIPYMISGEYQVKTTLNGITVEDEISVESNKTYYISHIDLEDELEDKFEDQAIDRLNDIYRNAINGTSYDEMKEKIPNMEKTYKNLKRTFANSSLKINELIIKDAELKDATYNSEGNLEITFLVDYALNYTYNLNGEDKTNSNDSSSIVVLTFAYNSGEYTFYDLKNELNLKVRW